MSFSAQKDTVLPLSKPIIGNDGTEVSEIVVPKSTNVLIAIRGANRSADIWGPDAEEWKPERWLSPLPDSVAKARILECIQTCQSQVILICSFGLTIVSG